MTYFYLTSGRCVYSVDLRQRRQSPSALSLIVFYPTWLLDENASEGRGGEGRGRGRGREGLAWLVGVEPSNKFSFRLGIDIGKCHEQVYPLNDDCCTRHIPLSFAIAYVAAIRRNKSP